MATFKRISSPAWIILALALLLILLRTADVFEPLELLTYDLRFQLRPVQKALEEIVLVVVDDESLRDLGSWPLPRDMQAGLVQALSDFGAKMVVFDILFAEPGPADDLLARSVAENGRVYLPVAFYVPENRAASRLIAGDHDILAGVVAPLKRAARGLGHINVDIDRDGKVRAVPLFIQHKGILVPQISVLAAIRYLGLELDQVQITDEAVKISPDLEIPVVDQNKLLINYVGSWNESFLKIPYVELLKDYVQLKEGARQQSRWDLKDKICFVGLTATGTSDLRAMPLERLYPMLGVQANVFQSIVERKFILPIGTWPNTVLNVLVFLTSVFVCRRWPPLRSLAGILLFGILYFIAAVILFSYFRWWIDLFLPLTIMGGTYVGFLAVRLYQELRRRELIEKELQIAQDIQKGFLPKEIPQIEGLTINAFLKASRYVGGDLYDVVPFSPQRVGVLIGDVAGKGISASLVMAQVISIFSVLARGQADGPALFRDLNNELCKRISGRFVTALYVLIDLAAGKAYATAAGHGPLLVAGTKDEQVEDVPLAAGIPLGLMEGSAYTEVAFDIEPGDKIAIFSDGVFEARNKSQEEFGIERIQTILKEQRGNSGERLMECLKEAIASFEDTGQQYDDITLLVMALENGSSKD